MTHSTFCVIVQITKERNQKETAERELKYVEIKQHS